MCLVERRYSILAHPWCRGGVAQYSVRQRIRMMYMYTLYIHHVYVGFGWEEGRVGGGGGGCPTLPR